jgi:hypothetical protein
LPHWQAPFLVHENEQKHEGEKMHNDLNYNDLGREIGIESGERIFNQAEALCGHAMAHIALTNEAAVVSLRAEYGLLVARLQELQRLLRDAPPSGGVLMRRISMVWNGAVAGFLIFAAIAFSMFAFEPFRFGQKGVLYCLGIGVVAPFLLDKVMDAWRTEWMTKWIPTLAFVAALISLMLLAVIRADIIMQALSMSSQTVIIDGNVPANTTVTDFYARDGVLLRAVMVLLALAMEVAAGIALHRVKTMLTPSTEDWAALRNEKSTIEQRLLVVPGEIKRLLNEPQAFGHHFWVSFYQAMFTHAMKHAMTKIVSILVVLLCGAFHAPAAERSTWVIAIDLSQSVGIKAHGGETSFDRNIAAVTKLLACVPAGSRIVIIGITENSFLQPSILLRAEIPDDAGYFGERLESARRQVVNAWQSRCKRLAPTAKYTDILGALFLAEEVFEQSPVGSERKLIVFSDMRQSSELLNLETVSVTPDFQSTNLRIPSMLANLKHVTVDIIGVEEANVSTGYWLALRKFWSEYFAAAGAGLETYAVLRELPRDEQLAR